MKNNKIRDPIEEKFDDIFPNVRRLKVKNTTSDEYQNMELLEKISNIKLTKVPTLNGEYVDVTIGTLLPAEKIDEIMSLFAHQLELAKIEAKIEQSYRCQELIEANRTNNEDGERYGEIVLLDVDDLQDELSELTKQKEEIENARN